MLTNLIPICSLALYAAASWILFCLLITETVLKKTFWFYWLKVNEICGALLLFELWLGCYSWVRTDGENIITSAVIGVVLTAIILVCILVAIISILGIYILSKMLYRFTLNRPFTATRNAIKRHIERNRRAAEKIAEQGLKKSLRDWLF